MTNFAQLKAQARRDVHASFAVPVVYTVVGTSTPLALTPSLTARLHNKIAIQPDPMGQTAGFATIIEGVTRVVFNREELAALGVTPQRGDQVMFPDYGLTFILDIEDPVNGPINDRWSVALSPQ